MPRLAALFGLDAFAGGLMVQSLLALRLFERSELSLADKGRFFFASDLLAAASFPLAAPVGARAGLVNTMVFTHIPSSLCLIAAAFAGSFDVALALALARAFLAQVDVPVRSPYGDAVVRPNERPAPASIAAVPAQPRGGRKPRPGRRADLGRPARLTPRALRRAEDRLRSDASRRVSQP